MKKHKVSSKPIWFIQPLTIWVVFRYVDPEDSFLFYTREEARRYVDGCETPCSAPTPYYLLG